MNQLQHLLTKLAEEGAEVAQIALKTQQFGPNEVMPGQPLDNFERCHHELDIVERLKEAELQTDGEVRKTIHDAWNDILWMREAVTLSKRAVEIAESKVTLN